MTRDIYLKKKLASSWFALLQELVCNEFEKIEIDFGKKTKQNLGISKKRFGKNQQQKMREVEYLLPSKMELYLIALE